MPCTVGIKYRRPRNRAGPWMWPFWCQFTMNSPGMCLAMPRQCWKISIVRKPRTVIRSSSFPTRKTLPSLRLLTSDFHIDDIRSAALLGDVDALQNLKPGSRHLLVFRPHGDVKIEKLTPEELVFLSALSAHTSLEITLANVCSKYPDFDPTAALGRLLHLGVFQMPPH